MLLGFAIEGVATMLCRLASKLLSDGEPQFAAAIDSFVATALVVAAFDYSGGYYNPVLATGLKLVRIGVSQMKAAQRAAIPDAVTFPVRIPLDHQTQVKENLKTQCCFPWTVHDERRYQNYEEIYGTVDIKFSKSMAHGAVVESLILLSCDCLQLI